MKSITDYLEPRYLSIFLDQMIIVIVAMICYLLLLVFIGIYDLENQNIESLTSFHVTVALIWTIYLNKDIYQGRSIGKYNFNLRVLDRKTRYTAGPFKCLLRNLTLFIWPIELLFLAKRKERRLGDLIARTIVDDDDNRVNKSINVPLTETSICIIVTWFVIYLLVRHINFDLLID